MLGNILDAARRMFPSVFSDVEFNSLSQKLVLSLIKVTPKKNVVASEHLVRMSLCKLATVATGDAKQELLLLLGYRDDGQLSRCYSKVAQYIKIMKQSDLTVTNRIYLNYTSDIDPNFIKDSSEKDGVQVEKVGFNYPKAAAAHINNVLSSMTFRRITEIVDGDDVNKSTKMIIISGAHYKGTWETPFDYRLTKLTKFYHMDGSTSKVPMMNTMGEFGYAQSKTCEVLTIKFMSYDTSITFVVPNNAKDFGNMLETIYRQKDFVNNLVKSEEVNLRKVSIPRFKIKTFVDWTGFLQGLGLTSVFTSNSTDLVGIFKAGKQNQPISLSKVKQKVFLQIDEMGVGRKIPDPKMTEKPPEMTYYRVPTFVVDKPFYFEVSWDVERGRYNIFAGVFYGPEPDLPSF
ncbi:hypothetical protein PYW08_015587 [Mythimna loreyi]|uniref:Uncharacterized protein n=1 Tax=Mythimna loreyi TaxID=667449 RepID=A0ACC2QW12_9NEOP|nr:hypothetical protein PYW08_015587 [Mythimna loreyi]